MKFILQVWPDLPDPTTDADMQGLLSWALDSIDANPDLRWEIRDDDGRLVASEVTAPRVDRLTSRPYRRNVSHETKRRPPS